MAKCPTPGKRRFTQAEAQAEAKRLNTRLHYRAQAAYACKCGAWHIGNPRVRNHVRALKRGKASGRTDAKGRRRHK